MPGTHAPHHRFACFFKLGSLGMRGTRTESDQYAFTRGDPCLGKAQMLHQRRHLTHFVLGTRIVGPKVVQRDFDCVQRLTEFRQDGRMRTRMAQIMLQIFALCSHVSLGREEAMVAAMRHLLLGDSAESVTGSSRCFCTHGAPLRTVPRGVPRDG